MPPCPRLGVHGQRQGAPCRTWGRQAQMLRWQQGIGGGRGKLRVAAGTVSEQQALDLYSVLQLGRDASREEIKQAYRRLAKESHPDMNGVRKGHQRFEVLKDAYDILSDDSLRHQYNTWGFAGLGQKFAHYREAERAGGRRPLKGGDVKTVVGLSFWEAVRGVERLVHVEAKGVCPDCSGEGVCPGSIVHECTICQGSGQVMMVGSSSAGRLSRPGACPECGGRGRKTQYWCGRCGGEGLARAPRSVNVRIPPGVDSTAVLRFEGRGDVGLNGGTPGDLYLYFRVRDVEGMRREGIDLHCQISIWYFDAILGSSKVVNTAVGTETLEIPPGSQHDQVLCLRGRGVQKLGKNEDLRGNMHFKLQIVLPDNLKQTEKLLLMSLAKLN